METVRIFGMEISMGKLTVMAILLSPAIAVLVSIWVQGWRDKKWWMRNILATLMATRHQPINDEIVKALNIIDIAFYNKPKVRKHWSEYFEMLHNTGYNNPAGRELWRQKKNLLMLEMAKVSGYKKKINQGDVDRVYIPVGLVPDELKALAKEAKPASKKKRAVKKKTQEKK